MKVYLSHSIRGLKGNAATNAEMRECCKAAVQVGKLISDEFAPGVLELYIPGEHEDALKIALDKDYLTVEQILEIDCQIIDSCDAVIVYVPVGDELQGGRMIEYQHAVRTAKPVITFHERDLVGTAGWLTHYVLRS